jgi:hypothetical protein
MWHANRVLRYVAIPAVVIAATAFTPHLAHAPVSGMTFKLKVVLRQTPATGKAPRAVTLIGHGAFAGGLGRVEIDSVDVPSAIRKGDFFIIRDSTNTFWARPSTLTVRRMNAPLVNPLEGINERLTSGTGTPRSLKAVFDTVSLDEMVNGFSTRHFRITADVVYPIGERHATQKIVIEYWLANLPVRVMTPFSSRIRGLPEAPMVNGAYREFIRTLAAANRVFGNAVTVRTVTMTSNVYGPGLGEDFQQAVDLTDLQPAEIDDRLFLMSGEYKLQRATRDTLSSPAAAVPPRKPPAR